MLGKKDTETEYNPKRDMDYQEIERGCKLT